MSVATGPVRCPYLAARRTESATLLLLITFLLGRHAMLGHEPPIRARSTTTVRWPSRASSQAMYLPGSPPPRMTFSTFSLSTTIMSSGRAGQLPVRIDDEFVCDAGVEGFVAFRRLLKSDHLDIDDLGDGQSVPKYRLHELPVVFQNRRLAGVEAVRLCPAQAEA